MDTVLSGIEAINSLKANYKVFTKPTWHVRKVGITLHCIENRNVQVFYTYCKMHRKMEIAILYTYHPRYASFRQGHGFEGRD